MEGDAAPEVVRGVRVDSPLGVAYETAIREWLSLHTQVPRPLYHYTRTDGLEGIIESKSFWASHAEYLSDASELRYAKELIQEVIADEAGRVGSERVKEGLLRNPETAWDSFVLGIRPFVVCFCAAEDLLSQWRGYGASGPAYALGLDFTILAVTGLPPGSWLRRVIYDRDQQVAIVRTTVRAWAAAIEDEIRSGQKEEDLFPYPALWILQRLLFESHLCFKNPAFSEEREWRLIKLVNLQAELSYARDLRLDRQLRDTLNRAGLPATGQVNSKWTPTMAEGLEIRFRRSSFGFVPYVQLPVIERYGVFNGRLPLQKVIQGPTPHAAPALESLKLFLEAKGYGFPNTHVQLSRIPLRGS